MSWSRLVIIAGALAVFLAGCGFEPVYRPGGDLAERLKGVYVAPVKSRVGQATRNALLDGIAALDRPATATHKLTLRVTSDRERVGIQADETASRINVVLSTAWSLTLLGSDGERVASGQLTRTVPYNVVDDDYASLIAERDAEKRAGQLIGEALRTRLLLLMRKG